MKKRLLIYLALYILLIPSLVSAVGISSKHLPLIFYEPNAHHEFIFKAVQFTDGAELFVQGEYADLVTYEEVERNDYQIVFKVYLDFPPNLNEAGRHTIYIGVADVVNDLTGSIVVQANVRTPLEFYVLHPYKSIESRLVARNININDPLNFSIFVNSRGKPVIDRLYADIEVFDKHNASVKTLKTQTVSIEPRGSAELTAFSDSANLEGGDYTAVATIHYDDESQTKQGTFRIGSVDMEILNHTEDLLVDRIGKFDLRVRSLWSGPVSNIYATVTIENQTIKTPSERVGPFGDVVLSSYYDTTGMKVGKYNAYINLYFENKNVTKKSKVYIVNEIGERPFPTVPVLIAVIIILVLLDILWFIYKHKKHTAQVQPGQQKKQTQSNLFDYSKK